MRYRWMDCPKCQCHLAINTTETPEGISGSLRRWSIDRSISPPVTVMWAKNGTREDR